MAPGDAATTAGNVMAFEGLFRLGIAGDAVVFLTEIILTALLYALLKPVSRTLSLAAAFARLAMTVMQGMNLLNYLLALTLLSGAGYLAGVRGRPTAGARAAVSQCVRDCGADLGAFFGLHTLLLGFLVYKSGYFPRILGALLIVAACGYLIDSFGNFLLPQYDALYTQVVVLAALLGELPFAIWLSIKGVDVKEWER